MRKILLALMAIMMLVGATASTVVAQDDATPEAGGEGTSSGETSFAKGLDAPATFFTERGDPVATLAVTNVERGWEEYGEFSEPDRGVEYVAVTFEVSSVSDDNLVVEQFDFSFVDGFGRNNSTAFVEVADDSDVELFEDDEAVASGEAIELVVVFELFEDAELGYFMWQPDSGVIILVDLTEI